jgi:hypothetical protein
VVARPGEDRVNRYFARTVDSQRPASVSIRVQPGSYTFGSNRGKNPADGSRHGV